VYLGADWLERHDDPALWDGVLAIPDDQLWAVRQGLRRYLFTFVRERARHRWTVERVGSPRVVAAGTLLEPETLTIGFARRFTGYKRPELIFHDAERLARILNAAERPVQLIFAGKSHPADDIGKHHLQRVYRRALDPMFGGRVAFVDDYDLHVAHFLVQGCDVWLNNPRKPLEASGTSGMKAAMNGVPHLSIRDGWWAEGFNNTNGWVIEGDAPTDNYDAVDTADASALYRLLEEEVVPTFYDRDANGIPHRWLAIVKEAIRTATPHFSARRMVKEYVDRMYAPAIERRLEVRS
jgi:glycogen phosphorylase